MQTFPNCSIVNLGNKLQVRTVSEISNGEELTLDYRREPLPNDYVSSIGAIYL